MGSHVFDLSTHRAADTARAGDLSPRLADGEVEVTELSHSRAPGLGSDAAITFKWARGPGRVSRGRGYVVARAARACISRGSPHDAWRCAPPGIATWP